VGLHERHKRDYTKISFFNLVFCFVPFNDAVCNLRLLNHKFTTLSFTTPSVVIFMHSVLFTCVARGVVALLWLMHMLGHKQRHERQECRQACTDRSYFVQYHILSTISFILKHAVHTMPPALLCVYICKHDQSVVLVFITTAYSDYTHVCTLTTCCCSSCLIF
jgi:hypothetical protein